MRGEEMETTGIDKSFEKFEEEAREDIFLRL